MNFELLPSITPFVAVFLTVAGVAIVLALAVLTQLVTTNRRTRVARHESIRTYYGRLAFSH